MYYSTWQVNSFSILFLICLKIVTKQVVAQDVLKPWYENLPGVAMDYKVIVNFLPFIKSNCITEGF